MSEKKFCGLKKKICDHDPVGECAPCVKSDKGLVEKFLQLAIERGFFMGGAFELKECSVRAVILFDGEDNNQGFVLHEDKIITK